MVAGRYCGLPRIYRAVLAAFIYFPALPCRRRAAKFYTLLLAGRRRRLPHLRRFHERLLPSPAQMALPPRFLPDMGWLGTHQFVLFVQGQAQACRCSAYARSSDAIEAKGPGKMVLAAP